MNLRRTSRFTFLFAALGTAAAAFWGCTASSNNTFATDTGGSGGNTGGAATTSSSSSGDGGGSLGIDAGMSDGNDQLDDASVCSGQEAQASLVPLDMIVLLDKSGSMDGEKWDTVTVALENFFNDPASAGIGAGLVYFPNDMSDDCVYTDYANLDVPIGVLPGNAPALVSSIDSHSPGGGTPTYGALKGALFAATSYQDAHPDHKVVVLIATDGDPLGCDIEDSTSIANLAKSARNYNGVTTYAIAVPGSTLSNLNAIAVAGGTVKAYDVTQDITQFAAKMAEIRSKALACEFPIPEPPMGEQLDPAKVNVDYTPGGSTTATTLPNVLGASQCSGKQAWYYDNNTAPTKIELCPAACQKVQADTGAKVSVKFGCKTIAM